jgi:sugar transferase (PEP-CTERM system associated)
MRIFNVYYPSRVVALLLSEALIVSTSFLLATAFVLGQDTVLVLNYEYGAWKIAGITGLTLLCAYYFDLYTAPTNSARWQIYFRVLLVLGLLSILLSAIISVYPGIAISRYIMPLGLTMTTGGLIAWRSVYDRVLNRTGFRERVCILGDGPLAEMVSSLIEGHWDSGMELVARVNAGPECESAAVSEQFSWLSVQRRIDRVVVALEERRNTLPTGALLKLRFQGIVIEEAASVVERLSGKLQLDQLRPSSFLYTDGFRLKPSQQISRRIVSMVAAAAGLLLFLPLLPIIVLLVRLSSPGPIFFRQRRVGLRDKPFMILKFRTMVQDAEAAGARWAVKGDPRVTRVGRFMRKTRLDEVPQLWNVLKGDMNFVGPRPERPEFVPLLARELPYYHLRHMIRPGLTGWAQVSYGYGGSMEETRHKLEYDLYYLKHMSLGLDLLIMFQTIKTILRRRGGQ